MLSLTKQKTQSRERGDKVSDLIKKENYLEIVDIIKSARERAYSKVNEDWF